MTYRKKWKNKAHREKQRRLHQQIKTKAEKSLALMSHLISMRTNRGFIAPKSCFSIFAAHLFCHDYFCVKIILAK
jgi:hypothetical protein